MFELFSFMFHRRQQTIWVWNNKRVTWVKDERIFILGGAMLSLQQVSEMFCILCLRHGSLKLYAFWLCFICSLFMLYFCTVVIDDHLMSWVPKELLRTCKYLEIWYTVYPNTCHHVNVIPAEKLHEKNSPFKINLKQKMYKTYTLPFESLGLDF